MNFTITQECHWTLFSAGYPEYDGGAPLTEFEVEMKSPNSSWQQSYRGKDTDCIITELSPGQTYVFHVRAFNRVGVSTSHFVIRATGSLVSCKSDTVAFYTVLINAETSDNWYTSLGLRSLFERICVNHTTAKLISIIVWTLNHCRHVVLCCNKRNVCDSLSFYNCITTQVITGNINVGSKSKSSCIM
jgi:hypothetical protein